MIDMTDMEVFYWYMLFQAVMLVSAFFIGWTCHYFYVFWIAHRELDKAEREDDLL